MADLRNRIIAPCAVRTNFDRPDVEVDFDAAAFVHRLILCDTYIIESVRLAEVPHLVRLFGLEGAIKLLRSPAVGIYCDALTVGQVGQAYPTVGQTLRKGGRLPLHSYSFFKVGVPNRRQYIRDCMNESLNKLEGLSFKERLRLQAAVAEALVDVPPTIGNKSIEQFRGDLAANVPTIAISTAKALHEKLKHQVRPSDFRIAVNQIDDTDFAVDADLQQRFSLSERQSHDVIEKAPKGGISRSSATDLTRTGGLLL